MPDIETSITQQIAALDKQIRELHEERHALERLLLKVRREKVLQRDVSRTNSVTRIMVEEQILKTLGLAHKPLSAAQIYRDVATLIHELKQSTFRSHLKRMKDKGLIKQKLGHGGRWYLPDSEGAA